MWFRINQMPWDKKKVKDKWQVVNSDTGDVKGTHDTESEADDQLAALYIHANPEEESKMEKNIFIPIRKIDAKRHEVWGWGAVEEPDAADEILDYATTKPNVLAWSGRAEKRSGGKSLGNVRSMHQPIATGKLIELRPDDIAKGFYVGAQIVDDDEWKKVEMGVYTGFSIGGNYEKRWADMQHPGKIRYTAQPTELSIVDAPCIPSATFEMVKAEGISKQSFTPGNGKNMIKVVGGYDDERQRLQNSLATAFPYEPQINGIPPIGGRYWIDDWTDDCVYAGGDGKYYKIPYTPEGDKFTFGIPVEVTRKTVYEPIEPSVAELPEVAKVAEAKPLQKQIPGAPEPIADMPLDSAVGPSFNVEQMGNPSVSMEITQNQTPAQDVLAEHAVQSEDLTKYFDAWLPKIGALIKSEVAKAVAEVTLNLSKTTNPAPARSILVKRHEIKNPIKVVRKES
jgi:hypothetical protein